MKGQKVFRNWSSILVILLSLKPEARAGGQIPFLFLPLRNQPVSKFGAFNFIDVSGTSSATSNTVIFSVTSPPGTLYMTCASSSNVSGGLTYKLNSGSYTTLCSFGSLTSGTVTGLSNGDILTIRVSSANAVTGTLSIYDTNSDGNLIDTMTYTMSGAP